MISLARCDMEMLLQATDDVAQRALARFRRGCARVAAGHLPGGANAVVVKGNDRDVHGAAAVRCRAQLSQNQGLELRLCLRRLVGHGPLLSRDAQRLRVQPAMRGQKRVEDALCPAMTTRVTCSRQTQNLGGGARRGAASRRLGMGIKPSRWASFLAALRERRMASAFSRVLRSDGFSYALRRFISRKTPSRCIFFLSTRRAWSTLLSRTSTCKMFSNRVAGAMRAVQDVDAAVNVF